jgi:homoserine/homoserine lactone efflux protein
MMAHYSEFKMMSADTFSLFISITLVLSASPGPVMLWCMSIGARMSFMHTLVGMLGISLGNLCLILLSAVGMGTLLHESPSVFLLAQLLGALYLMWLGWQILQSPKTHTLPNEMPTHHPHTVGRTAFLLAISNPKGIIYFGALFPQFIDNKHALVPQYSLLSIIFLGIDLFWMLTYALAGKSLMRWLSTSNNQRIFTILSGSILIASGIFMAFAGKISS